MLDYSKSFIEMQFPVNRVSKESYKERKAGAGQTLTGFGKWWGRKPLILVRASILGLLMPTSEDPKKDKEIFLKILMLDESGLWKRKIKPISTQDIYSYLNSIERTRYFEQDLVKDKPVFLKSTSASEKSYLQKLIFSRMSYDTKLEYCLRPEETTLDDSGDWAIINSHLKTSAISIKTLIQELSIKRYGHLLTLGDCFSGGGSIPFEAARIGANVYASDLNPIAGLLTWSALNLSSSDEQFLTNINAAREVVLGKVLAKIDEWGIETNEKGDIANSYLYCTEAKCPECGRKVPLSASWMISGSINAVALLRPNSTNGFDIEVVENASQSQLNQAKEQATVIDSQLVCPNPECMKKTPISNIRKDTKGIDGETVSGLRKWKKSEFISRDTDIFSDRLFAIRYLHGNKRYYVAPNEEDCLREKKVFDLLSENFSEWQDLGYIPSTAIESGYNTDQPMRERGWQYWHQMFNPRQLLVLGLINKTILELADSKEKIALTLGLNKFTDWNSKLSVWNSGAGAEKVQNTFMNQALNTIFNYGTRAAHSLLTGTIWSFNFPKADIDTNIKVETVDARSISEHCDVFITDPPYADAVNYHELTEFFLAWDKELISGVFPGWYTDSKRVLAVKGVGQSFNESMIEIYRNLANLIPNNGYQVVMFTHQDVKVWSELAMILWSAGLRVVSAWNVATETDTGGRKNGNYVQGTVILTLKKQLSNEMAFQDEIYDEIKMEVKNIIDSMRELDDRDEPDFSDADYLLASYASTLKVLTAYKKIEGVDVHYWLAQPRDSKVESPIEALINKAVRIAYDYLIPLDFDKNHWADMKPEERFFIRGLELEMNHTYKVGSYIELARGFGVVDYKELMENFKANTARLKTPSDFKMAFLNNSGFSSTLTRHILVALNETTQSKSTVEGRNYLRTVYNKGNEYWYKKPLMQEILSFIAKLEFVDHMPHWKEHAYSAKILKEALKNEGM